MRFLVKTTPPEIMRTDLTSSLKMLVRLAEDVTAVMAEVKLDVVTLVESCSPGTGMPRISSTARTTFTKFCWTK